MDTLDELGKFVNKLLIILVIIVIFIFSIGGLSSFGQSPINEDPLVVSIKEAANKDVVTNQDLGKIYGIYRGTYYYGQTFNFDGAKDFGGIFDKQRKIKELHGSFRAPTLGPLIDATFKKYEDINLDDNSKNSFLEDVNKVALGLKAGIE